jgi:hypothetical protein
MKITTPLVLAILLLLATMTTLHAEDQVYDAREVKVGSLRCDVWHGWGYLVSSYRYVECTFTPQRGEVEHYNGELSKLGIDIGYIDSGVIVWEVLAPATTIYEGALAGHYAGASVAAAVGAGGGLNVLVGGSGGSFSLQPVSVEGDIGLDVSVGAAYLYLQVGSP